MTTTSVLQPPDASPQSMAETLLIQAAVKEAQQITASIEEDLRRLKESMQ